MAQTVIVPEDKDIPLKDNFSFIRVDTNKLRQDGIKYKYAFEMRPKIGIWNAPFIAYPYSDSAKISAYFGPAYMGFSSMGTQIVDYMVNGKIIAMQVYILSSSISTKNRGNFLYCAEKPDFLIFGDAAIEGAAFIVKP